MKQHTSGLYRYFSLASAVALYGSRNILAELLKERSINKCRNCSSGRGHESGHGLAVRTRSLVHYDSYLSSVAKFLQLCKNRLGLQPLAVVGIAVSEHDFAMRIHNVDRRDWQRVVLLTGCFFKIASKALVSRERRIIDFECQPECAACLNIGIRIDRYQITHSRAVLQYIRQARIQ